MTTCRISSCSNDACGENDKKDDASRVEAPYHKPSIFTPPPSLCDRIKLLKRKCVRAINIVYATSRKIYYYDRFTWQLFKSLILFVSGIKVFYELYRYVNPDCEVSRITYVHILADTILVKLGMSTCMCRCS